MRRGSPLGSTRSTAVSLFALACACACRRMPSERHGLDCVYDFRAPITECAGVRETPHEALSLSDASELVLRSVTATWSGDRIVVDAELTGRFWNESNQNVYVFFGGKTTDGAPARYALTADPSFAADLSYAVRSEIRMPHAPDVRVGVMSPAVRPYSPQVYVTDLVHADAVGESAGIVVRSAGSGVHLEIPVERYFARKGAAVPDRLGVTVATARDYVGFVDQLSVRDLAPSTSKTESTRESPPASYPMLDARAHEFQRIAIRNAGDGVSVEIETAAPITDWAQTNLQFFFVPMPPTSTESTLHDPSKTRTIPYAWSYYCAVYSPRRLFCRASHGEDFRFDTAYAERASLPPTSEVSFREIAPGRYALDLGEGPTSEARGREPTFALLVSAGRDGFGPTTWYGASGRPR